MTFNQAESFEDFPDIEEDLEEKMNKRADEEKAHYDNVPPEPADKEFDLGLVKKEPGESEFFEAVPMDRFAEAEAQIVIQEKKENQKREDEGENAQPAQDIPEWLKEAVSDWDEEEDLK